MCLLAIGGCGGAASPGTATSSLPAETLRPLRGAYLVTHSRTGVVTLGNAALQRKLWPTRNGAGMATGSLFLRTVGVELLRGTADEVTVQIGEATWNLAAGTLQVAKRRINPLPDGRRQLILELQPASEQTRAFRVRVVYEIAADAPWMRKWVEVENTGAIPLPLVRVETEVLRPVVPDRTTLWTAEGAIPLVSADAAPSSGWLTFRYPFGVVFLVQETPPPFRSLTAPTTGELRVRVEDDPLLAWLAPGEQMILPGVHWWFGTGPLEQERKAFLATLQRTLRWTRPSRPLGLVFLVDPAAATQEWLGSLPPRTAVGVAYAWSEDWNRSEPPRLLRTALDRLRQAGIRPFLWVPVAWVPPPETVAEVEGWVMKSPSGEAVSATWHGRAGILAALDSPYGQWTEAALSALVDRLDVSGLLLDGPVLPESGTFQYAQGTGTRWRTCLRFLALLERLRQEHPQLWLGVAPVTIGAAQGFELSVFPFASLVVRGSSVQESVWQPVQEWQPSAATSRKELP